MAESIVPLVMPKWGLAMSEGTVVAWLVEEGEEIARESELVEIETTKINNVFESPLAGCLRRRVAAEGEVVPVGGLLAVFAPPEVAESEIDRFVADFAEHFVPEEAEAGEAAAPETVEAGGRRLRFLRLGEKGATPLLLLHGFGADLNSWMFVQPGLSEARATYALDLPGHGGSTKEVGAADLAAFAAGVGDFMDVLGLSTAHLVGHSLGGAIATTLARDAPGRVASLSLIAPAGLGSEIDGAFIEGFIAAKRRKQMAPVLEALVHDPSAVSREMIEDVLKFKRLDGVEAALGAIAGRLFPGGRQAEDLKAALEGLDVPRQAIWGAEDRIIPARQMEALAGGIARHLLPETGHMPQMERAHEVRELIDAFVSA